MIDQNFRFRLNLVKIDSVVQRLFRAGHEWAYRHELKPTFLGSGDHKRILYFQRKHNKDVWLDHSVLYYYMRGDKINEFQRIYPLLLGPSLPNSVVISYEEKLWWLFII